MGYTHLQLWNSHQPSFASVILMETFESRKYCYCDASNLSGSFNTPSWPAGKHISTQLTTAIKWVFKKAKIALTLSYDLSSSGHCPTYAKELLIQISQFCNPPPGLLLMGLDNHIKLHAAYRQSFFSVSVEMHLCRRLLTGMVATFKLIPSAPFEL